MKKIIPLVCCMMFFSVTDCNADSDVEKLKGCWESKMGSFMGVDFEGSKMEIGDKHITTGKDYIIDVTFETTDSHIIMNRTRKSAVGMTQSDKKYVLRSSITDTSFRESNTPETSPEKGLKYTRIQCPSK